MKVTIRAPRGLNGHSICQTICRRLWRFDADLLCAEARRSTRLEVFGDPAVERPLAALVESLERESDLHSIGRFLMWSHLRELLETRLRLVESWRKTSPHSAVERPIFILGMPRSGSTFLHELLTKDPGNRVPRVWEVMFPVEAGQPPRAGTNLRIWQTSARLWGFRRIAPQADAVYPMRPHTPHECVAIHSYTLLSEEFIASCHVPAYEAFLHTSDLRPTYLWQKRLLQHLQQYRPARQWVLKSPDHVHGLDALFSAFPDARVIQTHRNPLEVLKSSIQLSEVLQGVFARPRQREEIAERESRMLSLAVDRAMRFRDAHPELANRFIDVNYRDLTTDPMGQVRRIYKQFDMPLTRDAAQRIERTASERKRYAGCRTARKLSDLGLELSAVASGFVNYCSRYNVPCTISTH